uniref:Uncharacterized protein n=1 Tax=Caenorhabditis japonica TaxID=281687 RepID=A0A8R1IQC9_CAEJA
MGDEKRRERIKTSASVIGRRRRRHRQQQAGAQQRSARSYRDTSKVRTTLPPTTNQPATQTFLRVSHSLLALSSSKQRTNNSGPLFLVIFRVLSVPLLPPISPVTLEIRFDSIRKMLPCGCLHVFRFVSFRFVSFPFPQKKEQKTGERNTEFPSKLASIWTGRTNRREKSSFRKSIMA